MNCLKLDHGKKIKMNGKILFQVVIDYYQKFKNYNNHDPSQNIMKKKEEFFKQFKLTELEEFLDISNEIRYDEMSDSISLYFGRFVSQIKTVTEFRILFQLLDDMTLDVKQDILKDLKYLPDFVDKDFDLNTFEILESEITDTKCQLRTTTFFFFLKHIEAVNLMIFRLASGSILQDLEWMIYKTKINLVVCKTCKDYFLFKIIGLFPPFFKRCSNISLLDSACSRVSFSKSLESFKNISTFEFNGKYYSERRK